MKKRHLIIPLLTATLALLACVREPLAPYPTDEALYDQASASQANARYAIADSLYAEIVSDYPSSMRYDNAILGLAECQRALGARDSAVYTLRKMPSGSALYGSSLLRQGQYMVEDMRFWPSDSAPPALRRTISWDGDDAVVGEAWYSLGQAFYKMVGSGSSARGAYYDSALVAFSELRSRYSGHVRYSDAQYRIGWTLYQKGLWLRAADTLRTYAESYSGSALADGALYWAAKALGNAGQGCEAKALMQQMLTNYPYTDKRASALGDMSGWICQ